MNKLKFWRRDKLSTPVAHGVVSGIMQVCYIVLVAFFMGATENLFSASKPGLMIFGIICVLSLLVLSVAISGVLIFGWSAYYFLEKKYREALNCFVAVSTTIFVIFAIIFILATIVSLF